MTRWLRFILIDLRAIGGSRLAGTERADRSIRVWPWEADVSAANYSAYLTYFELRRLDLQLRSGVAWRAAPKISVVR